MRRRTSIWARLAAATAGIILIALAAVPTIGLAALFTLNLGPTSSASALPIGASPAAASPTPRTTPRPSPSPTGLVAQPDNTPDPDATPGPDASPDPDATPDPDASQDPGASPAPTAAVGPRRLNLGAKAAFVSQVTDKYCAAAAIQIATNMIVTPIDKTPEFQKKIEKSAPDYTTRSDSKNGGWGPKGMAAILAYNTGVDYRLRVLDTRGEALRVAAVAIAKTKNPAILLAWRGAHAWVMTGYQANGDPFGTKAWKVTGAYIHDPWYPRVSNIWGRSKAPGAFHNLDDLNRNFLPWKRPEGAYPGRDGKFLVIVPTSAEDEGG